MDDNLKVLEETEESLNKVEQHQEEDGLIHLSSGVILEKVEMSNLLLAELVKQYKEPEIPEFFNEDKQRMEENPADPDYNRKLAEYATNIGLVMLDASIMRGTKLHYIPPDVTPVEDDTWGEELIYLGMNISKNPRVRYLQWVKSVAAANNTDMIHLRTTLLPQFGVLEEDVETEMKKFPSDESGDTDMEIQPETDA